MVRVGISLLDILSCIFFEILPARQTDYQETICSLPKSNIFFDNCFYYTFSGNHISFRLNTFYSSGFIYRNKISIHGETSVLRKIFAEEYDAYENSVNELFPVPLHLFQEKGIKH
jgi:hypothetical protein